MLNLEPILIPPRSHLYHLEPIGIGTSYVESLTGYIIRLALSHNVTPGTLLSLEIAPLAKKRISSTKERSFTNIYGQTKHLNGMSAEVISHIKVIESLTLRNDLQFLTMLPWSEVLDIKGLLRPTKAWCGHCYEQWRMSKLAIYEPLLWFISAVKFCPYHYQTLSEHCPKCKRISQPISRLSIPGHCPHCKHWLGISEEPKVMVPPQFTSDELKYEKWVLENIGKLVSMPAYLKAMPSKEWLAEVFSNYAKSVGSVAELARLLGISVDKMHMWATGKNLITLKSLLLVCRSLEISVSQFLTTQLTSIEISKLMERKVLQQPQKHSLPGRTILNLSQKKQIFQDALDEYPPPSIRELAIRHGYSHAHSLRKKNTLALYDAVRVRHENYQTTQRLQKQESALKVALESEEYPPRPMRKVAEQIGMTVQTLYKNFPELCQSISRRYLTYQEMAGIRSMLKARRQIWLIANEIHKEGMKPTDGRISHRLPNKIAINREDLLQAAKEARHRLGWE